MAAKIAFWDRKPEEPKRPMASSKSLSFPSKKPPLVVPRKSSDETQKETKDKNIGKDTPPISTKAPLKDNSGDSDGSKEMKKKVDSVFFSPNETTSTPERKPKAGGTEVKRRSFLPWFQKGDGISSTKTRAKPFREIDFGDIIKKGPLMKRGNIRKNWKQKYCIMTSEVLYIFDKEEHVGVGQSQNVLLQSVTRMQKLNEETFNRRFCFRFVSPTGEDFLQAPNEEEFEDWFLKMKPQTKAGDEPEETKIYLGRYESGRTIGVGGYAEVKVGRDLKEDRKVAIKVIRKDQTDAKSLERLNREITFLCCMEHPNVVKLYDVHETDTLTILIMEFVEGETLDDFLYDTKGQCLPDYVCRFFFHKLVSAVKYCHDLMVVHRDLKMENIIVNLTGNLWLLDFGLSNRWTPGMLLETYCGTLEYAAPEVLSKEKPYEGGPCDVWSLGVVLFLLLTGKFPFEDESIPVLLEKLNQGHEAIEFPSTFSDDLISLFQIIFIAHPQKRATIPRILAHPWMLDNALDNQKSMAYFASLE